MRLILILAGCCGNTFSDVYFIFWCWTTVRPINCIYPYTLSPLHKQTLPIILVGDLLSQGFSEIMSETKLNRTNSNSDVCVVFKFIQIFKLNNIIRFNSKSTKFGRKNNRIYGNVCIK